MRCTHFQAIPFSVFISGPTVTGFGLSIFQLLGSACFYDFHHSLSADFLKTEDNFIPLHEYCTEAVSRTLPRIVRRYVRTFTQLGFSFFIFIFVFLGGRTLELRDPGSGILHRINFRFINTALSCRITMKFIEFTLRTHPSEGLFNTIRAPSERRQN